ncbi:MAG: toll/interleukin-1 receptor domain-containing protein, partial [Mollicutes bacterium]|nr:toll/interleukin-1 receptor domain-containing protein [Mollicutes bacterium]
MAKFKCKMCGAPLNVNEGQTVATCDFCQSKQTVANANDERKENLFNRANSLRAACDFDKAILSYQSILTIFPDEPEAYWGLCLCKYGIEYVNDPVTKKKIPTIHRASYDSILKDSDYLAALSYADLIAKEVYQEEAKQIAEIQQNILSISQKEEPFDIFICYKETTETGKRTRDSVLAQEVYSNLTDKGYKVFFSRITLESKLGSMYEPYIFAALNSAKIMLVFGTKKEYFEAVWVKNEWSRFIDMMKTRPDHYLIPCYRDMDAYEMPEQFLAFQGQDMSKLGFMQDLMRGVDKIMGRLETPKVHAETKIIQSDVNINALLKRAEILIGDGEFTKADEVLEMALNNDPTNSQAYLLKLLIELKYTSIEELKTSDENLESNSNFKKAYKFGDDQQKNILNSINEAINERIEQVKFEKEYEIAIGYKDMKKFLEAKEAFLKLSGFKDSDKQALECAKEVYNQALSLKEEKSFLLAIDLFQKIKEYEDSEFQITNCKELFNKELYDEACQLKDSGYYIKAAEIFASLHEYQDAENQVNECYRLKD